MEGFADGGFALDGGEETDELLMAVALHVLADRGSVEHIHRRKQGRPVPLVVVGHGPSAPLLERQSGLGSVERLDLALFVDAEHDRVRRRINIEPDDVAQLVDERRIFRQLELPDAMRLEPVSPPDALHGTDADPVGLEFGAAGLVAPCVSALDPIAAERRRRRSVSRGYFVSSAVDSALGGAAVVT
jgi:hypothetical protein